MPNVVTAPQTLLYDDGKRQIWSFLVDMTAGDDATILNTDLTSIGPNMQIVSVQRGQDAVAVFQAGTNPARPVVPVVDFNNNAIDFVSLQATTGSTGGVTPDASAVGAQFIVEVVNSPATA